ncbi:MAG: HAD family hydrolase [Angelakisella sp.]|nr:HAD family hydrolase [Angelakisella sp.]
MEARCVLFDFDGVIADTEESNVKYLGKALAVFGVVITPEEQAQLVGMNDPRILEKMLRRARPPVTLEQLLEERKRQGNTYEDDPDLAPTPGVIEFLHRLRAAGKGIALVSSTSARLILAALNRLGLTGFFDVIICGDMVSEKKPSPECYRKAMALLRARPEECVIVEDSPVGIRAGKAAGAVVAACRCGRLRQDTSQADFEFESFEECMRLPVF